VRDLSEDGARIVLSQTITIPDVIELQIPQRETLSARVQWRRADEVGLSFSKPDTATTAGKSAHQAHRRAQSRNHHAPAHHQASQARQQRRRRDRGGLERNAFRPKRLTL
jgi:PilZ domain